MFQRRVGEGGGGGIEGDWGWGGGASSSLCNLCTLDMQACFVAKCYFLMLEGKNLPFRLHNAPPIPTSLPPFPTATPPIPNPTAAISRRAEAVSKEHRGLVDCGICAYRGRGRLGGSGGGALAVVEAWRVKGEKSRGERWSVFVYKVLYLLCHLCSISQTTDSSQSLYAGLECLLQWCWWTDKQTDRWLPSLNSGPLWVGVNHNYKK